MSVAELQELEEVRGLITHGQQVGVLSYAEIATATAELGLDESDVEELHGLFERSEIELVEEIDPATAASLNIERAPEKRTRRRAPPDLKPEGTTDALGLFLKGIGKVRLLSAQEEVDSIKRIERGSRSTGSRLLQHLSTSFWSDNSSADEPVCIDPGTRMDWRWQTSRCTRAASRSPASCKRWMRGSSSITRTVVLSC